jgi:ubiquinone/menaquinone biosynthesis C-methylase UbiE
MVAGREAKTYCGIARKRRWWTDRSFVREALSLPPAPCRVLDVGCGPGHVAIMMARESPGLSVVALDLSPDMLAAVSRNSRKAGVGHRVVPMLGNMTSLPFDDDSFDLVVSQYALHHLRHPAGAVTEMRRVLRPGGLLFVKDMMRPASRWRARFLVGFVGLIIGYDREEKRQYLESTAACLSWDEARRLAGNGVVCERRAFSQFVLKSVTS